MLIKCPTINQIAYTEPMHKVPVYQTEQIRQIEEYLFSLDPKPNLMESAGKAVADLAIHETEDASLGVLTLQVSSLQVVDADLYWLACCARKRFVHVAQKGA